MAAFALYPPCLVMTLSSQLYSVKDVERQMLFEHLDQLERDDLLVLDQGYSARWLIACRVQQGIQFCIRVDETGFAAVKSFLRSGACGANRHHRFTQGDRLPRLGLLALAVRSAPA